MKAGVKEVIDNRWLTSTLRVALGGIFIASSIGKLQYRDEFTDTVISYGILPNNLAEFYGFVLPWAELFIGCALVLGIFSRFASAISVPIIVSFIIANVYGLFRPVGDICECFGQLVSLSHPVSLVIDVVMLSMAGQLLLHKDKAEFLSIGSLLCRLNLGLGRRGRFIFEKANKFAVVVLVMLVAIFLIVGAQTSPSIDIDSAPGSESEGTQGSSDTEPDEGTQGSDSETPEPEETQSWLDLEIDSALESGKLAFLFFWTGCKGCLESQFKIVADLESEYDRIVFIEIYYYKHEQGIAMEEAEKFDVKTSPTMLLIIDKDEEGEYVVCGEPFEGKAAVDKGKLKDCFDQCLEI